MHRSRTAAGTSSRSSRRAPRVRLSRSCRSSRNVRSLEPFAECKSSLLLNTDCQSKDAFLTLSGAAFRCFQKKLAVFCPALCGILPLPGIETDGVYFAFSSIAFAAARPSKIRRLLSPPCKDGMKRWKRWRRRRPSRGKPMRRIAGLALVSLSAVSLAGCLHLRSAGAGPCYGVGCPTFTSSSHPQSSSSKSDAAQDQQSAASQSSSPAAKKPHGFHALLKKAKL